MNHNPHQVIMQIMCFIGYIYFYEKMALSTTMSKAVVKELQNLLKVALLQAQVP